MAYAKNIQVSSVITVIHSGFDDNQKLISPVYYRSRPDMTWNDLNELSPELIM